MQENVLKLDVSFPQSLRRWRRRRGLSQLDLALTCDSSQRHISFLESGRANPSREMVLKLGDVLSIPFAAQNDLLLRAGFAPVFQQTPLSARSMTTAKKALDRMMELHNPLPAICFDPFYNIQLVNDGANKLFEFLSLPADQSENVNPFANNIILGLANPKGFGQFVQNLDMVLVLLLKRLDAEIAAAGAPDEAIELMDATEQSPIVPNNWRHISLDFAQQPFLEFQISRDDVQLRLFTTITTFGAPGDITLQDVRLESYYPSDEQTRLFFQG